MQPGWFWNKDIDKLEVKPLKEIIDELSYTNQYYSNYLLNAAPKEKDLMDDNIVNRLKEVGEIVTLSAPLTSLPQGHAPHKDVKIKT